MANENNALYVPHGWNTAVGLVADLHLVGAIPVATYVEFLSPSPYIDELILDPFKPDSDGMLTIPLDRPGLGIQLNPDALAKYGVRG
jgi:L-alanine-DL-glutamate epimerase-like enolase superfamily enzyme